jgi:hypothetical protein
MVDEFIIRVGTFFILIGVGIFILFVASDYANQTNFDYLFWAVLSVTIGILLRRRKPAPPPSERFSYLRNRMQGNRKNRKEEKK